MRRLFLLMPLLAAGCASGPDHRPPSAGELAVPGSFLNAPAVAASPEELAAWWLQFDDPLLGDLVVRAAAGNLDVAQAEARLRQAREALIQARAGRVPSIGASAGAGRNFDTDFSDGNSLSLGIDASWQADLFGGISRSIEAAEADEQSVSFNLAALQTAIAGETASNYVQARLAQQRLALARESLGIADENLEIAGWRVQAGLVSSLDVEQARAARAQTAASIPNLESSVASASYRLAVLTGQAPGALSPELADLRPIPTGPDQVAAGIPADVLRQRPDIRAAERDLASATARIGVAEAQLRPSLSIGGDLGNSALGFGSLVDRLTGSLFARLGQVLFDGGRLRSQVRAQEAAAEGAFASYRQTILLALEDVENALVSLEAAKARQLEFSIALEAAENTAILARSQYRAGLTDFRTLLEAERSLISARDGILSARAEQALSVIQLYLALGGGWTPPAGAPGIAS
jgi:outer membrane protein, multidrug efflux system